MVHVGKYEICHTWILWEEGIFAYFRLVFMGISVGIYIPYIEFFWAKWAPTIVWNGVRTSNLIAGRGPLWFFDSGEKQRNAKHLLLSKQLNKTSWGWNITHIEIFQTTATHLSLDIQTPAEKVFGPQKYTFNTFSGGIWMFRVILHHVYCISILVGGWTDQTEKYARQNGFIFLNFRGENQKIFETTTQNLINGVSWFP